MAVIVPLIYTSSIPGLTFPNNNSWFHFTCLPHDEPRISTPYLYPVILNDSDYIQTSSVNNIVSSSTISQSVITFRYPATPINQYYISEALLAVQTDTASTSVGVSMRGINNNDTFYVAKMATSTSSLSIRHKGTADTSSTSFLTASLALANTPFPVNIKGLLIQNSYQESDSSGFTSSIDLISATASSAVRIMSESLWLNRYAGFSSSILDRNTRAPLGIHNGYFREISSTTGDRIAEFTTPPTGSPWKSSSISADISTTSATAYTQVFSITGLTDNRRYLVAFYIEAQSAATTTGFRIRATTGSNYCGTIYTPTTVNAQVIGNSSGSISVSQATALNFPAANESRLVHGEYLVTKTAGLDPSIDIISEIAGSAVTAKAKSVVFWREVVQSKSEVIFPIGILSQSISSFNLGKGIVGMNSLNVSSNSLGFGSAGSGWAYVMKTQVTRTSLTGSGIAIGDLSASLDINSRYLFIGYLGVSSNLTTNGITIGVTTGSVTSLSYNIEVPSGLTTINNGFSDFASSANFPSADINNFYMAKVIALVRTAGAGSPYFGVTLGSELNTETASMGPSIIFWKKYF